MQRPMSEQPCGVQRSDGQAPRQTQAVDDKNIEFIRTQLLLLLHAEDCRKKEQAGNVVTCTANCRQFREVLNHLTKCRQKTECTFPHCHTSRKIILHCRRCSSQECKICEPMRQLREENAASSTTNGTASTSRNGPTSNAVNGYPSAGPPARQAWHQTFPTDKREKAVRTFVYSVFPNYDQHSNQNRMAEFREHVKEIERDAFLKTHSMDSYIDWLGKKCYELIVNLNSKDSRNNQSEPGHPQPPSSEGILARFNDDLRPAATSVQVKREPEVKQEPDVKPEPTTEVKSESQEAATVKEEPDLGAGPASVKPPVRDTAVDPAHRKRWSSTELLENFLPLLNQLDEERDAEPFRIPVDWETLKIPNYPEIVKHPMDLSTIRKKLQNDEYDEPWHVVDDFWLMFNNAWLFNKKNSKVYKNCTKLSEVFEKLVDPVMQSLGFCCGRQYVFLPQLLNCSTVNMCRINRDAVYYQFKNDDKTTSELVMDKYPVCEKCYNDSHEAVPITDDTTIVRVAKNRFEKLKNNIKEHEKFVCCQECGRKWHAICACHMNEIWPQGYVCPQCTEAYSFKRRPNNYTAAKLPTCRLSNFLEQRVNNYLRKNCINTGEVIIRVLASADKAVEVKPGMKSRYVETGEMPESIPYRVKAIFAFQVIDGQEVCFFGLHVQEYGTDSQPPNRSRVYIAYLDSVYFFQPKHCRTDIYHEILVGYLAYARLLHYTTAHIWACPPSEGDDYIFHMHPFDQKIPKPKRLQEWYQKMLNKARSEGVVVDYKDIYSDAYTNGMVSPTELPYFEGDYWPNALEEIFKELDDEEMKRKKETMALAKQQQPPPPPEEEEEEDLTDAGANGGQTASPGSNSGGANGPASSAVVSITQKKNRAKKRKLKKASLNGSSKRKRTDQGATDAGSEVSKKVYEMMEKHKDNFFVIRLHPASQAANLGQIKDPDRLISCELMECRDTFLTRAREKHLEFSTLRRAKYSTLCMLYEVHTEDRQPMIYTCNTCSCQLEHRWHCRTCDEFDLCQTCYEKEKHPHEMVKLGPDKDSDNKNDSNAQPTQREMFERYVRSFAHSHQCRDINCRTLNCLKFKGLIKHFKLHKERRGCTECNRALMLTHAHSRTCTTLNCPVPYCVFFRNKKEQQQRKQQSMMARRRMAAMNRSNSNANQSSNANTPVGGYPQHSPASVHTPGGPHMSQPNTPYGGAGGSAQIQSPQMGQQQHHAIGGKGQHHSPMQPQCAVQSPYYAGGGACQTQSQAPQGQGPPGPPQQSSPYQGGPPNGQLAPAPVAATATSAYPGGMYGGQPPVVSSFASGMTGAPQMHYSHSGMMSQQQQQQQQQRQAMHKSNSMPGHMGQQGMSGGGPPAMYHHQISQPQQQQQGPPGAMFRYQGQPPQQQPQQQPPHLQQYMMEQGQPQFAPGGPPQQQQMPPQQQQQQQQMPPQQQQQQYMVGMQRNGQYVPQHPQPGPGVMMSNGMQQQQQRLMQQQQQQQQRMCQPQQQWMPPSSQHQQPPQQMVSGMGPGISQQQQPNKALARGPPMEGQILQEHVQFMQNLFMEVRSGTQSPSAWKGAMSQPHYQRAWQFIQSTKMGGNAASNAGMAMGPNGPVMMPNGGQQQQQMPPSSQGYRPPGPPPHQQPQQQQPQQWMGKPQQVARFREGGKPSPGQQNPAFGQPQQHMASEMRFQHPPQPQHQQHPQAPPHGQMMMGQPQQRFMANPGYVSDGGGSMISQQQQQQQQQMSRGAPLQHGSNPTLSDLLKPGQHQGMPGPGGVFQGNGKLQQQQQQTMYPHPSGPHMQQTVPPQQQQQQQGPPHANYQQPGQNHYPP